MDKPMMVCGITGLNRIQRSQPCVSGAGRFRTGMRVGAVHWAEALSGDDKGITGNPVTEFKNTETSDNWPAIVPLYHKQHVWQTRSDRDKIWRTANLH